MKKLINEFKEFISRGSVVDLAVGIIIGSAFTAIVTSLVNDIIMPLISLITGGLDFSMWNIALTSAADGPVFAMGSFISAVINFLIVAFVIFMLIKALNKFNRKKDEAPEAPTTKKCPYCLSEIPIEATRCAHCTSELPVEEK